MRLPGSTPAKVAPFASRLLHCVPVKPWRWPELAEALGLPHGIARTATAGEWKQGERNPALYRFACGLRGQGLEHAEAMRRVAVANATSCDPPLDTVEVEPNVANAWRSEVPGCAKRPPAVLDSAAFRAMPD